MAENKVILDVEVNTDQVKSDLKKLNKDVQKQTQQTGVSQIGAGKPGAGIKKAFQQQREALKETAFGSVAGFFGAGTISSLAATGRKYLQEFTGTAFRGALNIEGNAFAANVGDITEGQRRLQDFNNLRDTAKDLLGATPFVGGFLKSGFDIAYQLGGGRELEHQLKKQADLESSAANAAIGRISQFTAAGVDLSAEEQNKIIQQELAFAKKIDEQNRRIRRGVGDLAEAQDTGVTGKEVEARAIKAVVDGFSRGVTKGIREYFQGIIGG